MNRAVNIGAQCVDSGAPETLQQFRIRMTIVVFGPGGDERDLRADAGKEAFRR